MESFSVKELFEDRINQLWDDEKYKDIFIRNNGYAVQDDIIKNAILFIGINPSLGKENNKTSKNDKDTGKEDKEIRIFYPNSQEYDENTHPYFKKFIEIHKETGLPWTHLDLFYIRNSNQKEIEILFEESVTKDFAKEQYLISKEIIELARPRVIVVNNAYARKWLTDKQTNNDCFKCKFDNEIGTYRIQDNPILVNTPIFFTSMLTGQRALDLGSYERLKWHIKFVLNKLKANTY